MSKLKFKDGTYDSKQLLEETGIGHILTDATIYTTFRDFDNKVFRNPLDEMADVEEAFPHIGKLNSFSKMLDGAKLTSIDLDIGDWEEEDYRIDTFNCLEIEFDFEVTPCYIQLINLTETNLETVKEYLTAYDWRFDIVGFFRYKGNDYIYLLCDEEN